MCSCNHAPCDITACIPTLPSDWLVACLSLPLGFKLLEDRNYVYLNAQCLVQSFLSHNRHSTLLLNEWVILATSLPLMPHSLPIIRFYPPSKYFSNSLILLHIHRHHPASSSHPLSSGPCNSLLIVLLLSSTGGPPFYSLYDSQGRFSKMQILSLSS